MNAVDFALHCFVTLFVIIDPPAIVPIFNGLTQGLDATTKRAVALKGAAVASTIVLLFGLGGGVILRALGLTLPAFRVGGGLLLFLIAVEMVLHKRTDRRAKTAEAGHQEAGFEDPSVFPLGFPLISGPGTITSVVLLAGEGPDPLLSRIILLAAAGVVLLLTYLAMRLAGPLGTLVGPTISEVITRLFGVLLAAISVTLVVIGLRQLWALPLPG
jgi:multiple antibiotic resistance protein